MAYVINEIVEQVGKIAIEGNVIPNEWYIHLRNDKGKIQTNASLILSDIVYWYRPIPIYDINSGQIIGYGKKFKDDLLQISYRYFNNKFGLSQGQVRNALSFLEDKGLIVREFRNIVIDGHVLNNVMYIAIYPDKIAEITGKSTKSTVPKFNEASDIPALQLAEIQNQESPLSIPVPPKSKQKDWSAKFTEEQKAFLDYLLNIKPEVGIPIERDHATWWIKSFGIEKIKIALQVYWQRVQKAKQDSTVPMPQHIGKYIRKALNDGLIPTASINAADSNQQATVPPFSEKPNQGVSKIEPGPEKNETTNTQTSMRSVIINEVNDKHESVTFQEEEKILNEQEPKKASIGKREGQSIKPKAYKNQETVKKEFRLKQNPDWKSYFTSEEKKFLTFLLSIIPAIGGRIEEKHATWWIKHFGIDKIKIALQVYWQQVEKAKIEAKVPMPASIGAYVRNALNKETQPCREADHRNKAFAERFKKQNHWIELTITEKYCRVEEIGKEWHYNLPEAIFTESLKRTFENYCSLSERRSCAA